MSTATAAPWALASLPAGGYEVEVERAGCGSWRSGRQWVDGGGVLDLGGARLTSPGTLRFDVPDGPLPEGLAVEIVGRRGQHDVRFEVLRRLDEDLWIAPGSYRLLWRVGEGPVASERFEIASDATVRLGLRW